LPEEELIRTAVLSLGLNDVSPFDPRKKIIEYQFEENKDSLIGLSLRAFADEVSSDSPAPGGGSVAALCGVLSGSLSAMVANLTVGKKGYEKSAEEMKGIAVSAQKLKDELLQFVDLDTRAFNKVMDAFRMPKVTEDQIREKERAVEEATKEAARVPLDVLRKAVELLELALSVALRGNTNSLSDAGVAALAAQAAAEGAYYNIRINLPNIQDEEFKTQIKRQGSLLRRKCARLGSLIKNRIEKELTKAS
jgi:glutamate formiminotransferase/formiminotetrahydrofolate cyclodeaminase